MRLKRVEYVGTTVSDPAPVAVDWVWVDDADSRARPTRERKRLQVHEMRRMVSALQRNCIGILRHETPTEHYVRIDFADEASAAKFFVEVSNADPVVGQMNKPLAITEMGLPPDEPDLEWIDDFVARVYREQVLAG